MFNQAHNLMNLLTGNLPPSAEGRAVTWVPGAGANKTCLAWHLTTGKS